MCRNIKTLAHFDPPATQEEVYAASVQFVRKIAGSPKPSKNNEGAYTVAAEQIALVTDRFIKSLSFSGPYRNREKEIEKARVRSKKRFS